jgi:hypothetical protein
MGFCFADKLALIVQVEHLNPWQRGIRGKATVSSLPNYP